MVNFVTGVLGQQKRNGLDRPQRDDVALHGNLSHGGVDAGPGPLGKEAAIKDVRDGHDYLEASDAPIPLKRGA